MTEQAATPPVTATAAPHPGPLAEVAGWFHHGEADAAKIAGAAATLITDHAGQALDIAGDFLALIKLIDPAAVPLAAAAQALLAKILPMAENAARDVRAALLPPASQPPAL